MKFLTTAMLVAAFALSACETTTETAQDPNAAGANSSGTSQTPLGPPPESVAYFNQIVGDRVFFATDQHDLDVQSMATLDRQAQWLQTNAATNVTVEGHADERGTRQYNLALGARRANSVRNYLIQRGVAAARVRAVTFGKERPTSLCSDDGCWSQNRRGVTLVTGAPAS